jgi:hypothetical protein
MVEVNTFVFLLCVRRCATKQELEEGVNLKQSYRKIGILNTNLLTNVEGKLPSNFCSINQQDTERLDELDDVGKMTKEREQAVMAYLEYDDDDRLGYLSGNH